MCHVIGRFRSLFFVFFFQGSLVIEIMIDIFLGLHVRVRMLLKSASYILLVNFLKKSCYPSLRSLAVFKSGETAITNSKVARSLGERQLRGSSRLRRFTRARKIA